MTSDDLPALETKISAELARRPECFITQPRELRIVQRMSASELRKFALDHGWRVIRRVGGRQFQFYNDTYARAHARE